MTKIAFDENNTLHQALKNLWNSDNICNFIHNTNAAKNLLKDSADICISSISEDILKEFSSIIDSIKAGDTYDQPSETIKKSNNRDKEKNKRRKYTKRKPVFRTCKHCGKIFQVPYNYIYAEENGRVNIDAHVCCSRECKMEYKKEKLLEYAKSLGLVCDEGWPRCQVTGAPITYKQLYVHINNFLRGSIKNINNIYSSKKTCYEDRFHKYEATHINEDQQSSIFN